MHSPLKRLDPATMLEASVRTAIAQAGIQEIFKLGCDDPALSSALAQAMEHMVTADCYEKQAIETLKAAGLAEDAAVELITLMRGTLA